MPTSLFIAAGRLASRPTPARRPLAAFGQRDCHRLVVHIQPDEDDRRLRDPPPLQEARRRTSWRNPRYLHPVRRVAPASANIWSSGCWPVAGAWGQSISRLRHLPSRHDPTTGAAALRSRKRAHGFLPWDLVGVGRTVGDRKDSLASVTPAARTAAARDHAIPAVGLARPRKKKENHAGHWLWWRSIT